MKRSLSHLHSLCLISFIYSSSVLAQCPPSTTNQDELLALREQQFVVDDPNKRQALALDLVPCLKSIDPVLRDRIAFEAFSTWMRAKDLTVATTNALYQELLSWLPADAADPTGVAKPFAILVLAEIARMDRVEPFMNDSQRQQLVNAVTSYLPAIQDYRGFDEKEGWRHGVAHSADLVLQLSLNPNINAEQLQAMAKTVASQIVPKPAHFYIYGEHQRLARAVYYLMQRAEIEKPWWENWFAELTPTESVSDLFTSQIGLAKRHNLLNFYTILYVYIAENSSQSDKDLYLPLITTGIAALG